MIAVRIIENIDREKILAIGARIFMFEKNRFSIS